MKRLFTFIFVVISVLNLMAQEYNPQVESMIEEVNLDSLKMFVRNLTGEDSVRVNGEMVRIEHRVDSWGNDLAAEYVQQVLEEYGLEPTVQNYSTNGTNVFAVQEGTLYPDQYYMICAHYDAVDYYCADDNASGSAAVLEAARILTPIDFEYSIIYALWDQEEIGLVGSNYYAQQAASNGDDILSVINMDMIAWDNDEDMVAEIHTNSATNTQELADYIMAIDDIYDLATNPVIQNPGTTASDHSRFWNQGYAAVLMIEEYYGGDFNPYYHTENDRISIFNLPYFHEMAKLSIGSIVSLASPVGFGTGIDQLLANGGVSLNNYPNPFSGQTTISIELAKDDDLQLVLMSSQGAVINKLVNGPKTAGKHEFTLNADELPNGIYFLIGTTQQGSQTRKLIIQ
ncbi:MAG: M28 family peptidase [Bacteroidetes bacterium]|nr:M28 family peptidase [Bacteroidota bacterium]